MSTTTIEGFPITASWVRAGKAVFTVHNDKGDHYTYKVTRKDEKGRAPVWFVSLLSGPDNMSDYTYVGVLNAANGSVRLTRASRFNDTSRPYMVVDWALRNVWAGKEFPAGYGINGEGRCGRCGRRLTHPDGVDDSGYRLGYGPECWSKMRGE